MRNRSVVLSLVVIVQALMGCTSSDRLSERPMVVAHRGASGYLPEHTLEAYAAAYFMGADMIEPDVVSTRDGQLVCFHDLYLEKVTDVEQRFPARARADGHWYVIDFTLVELKTLSVTGRGTYQWDGMQIPTFEQMLNLIAKLNEQTGRRVGVIPEIKKPRFHQDAGFDLPAATITTLVRIGWDRDDLIIQCFDPGTLLAIRKTHGDRFRLAQLIGDLEEVPSLVEIAEYADGIGPSRDVIDENPALIAEAHRLGLLVIPYTFKADRAPVHRYIHEYGVDGLFTDHSDIAIRVRDGDR